MDVVEYYSAFVNKVKEEPHREPVDSTCVREAQYDAESDELTILFTDSTEYVYYGVGGHQYARMIRSPSPGWYLNTYIRNNYSYSKIR